MATLELSGKAILDTFATSGRIGKDIELSGKAVFNIIPQASEIGQFSIVSLSGKAVVDFSAWAGSMVIRELCGKVIDGLQTKAAKIHMVHSLSGKAMAEAQQGSVVVRIGVGEAYGPNLLTFQPFIGGGGNLTFDVGTPGVATYWELIGIDPEDDYEKDQNGYLLFKYVKADASGLATNVWVAPKDVDLVGQIDRVRVKKIA